MPLGMAPCGGGTAARLSTAAGGGRRRRRRPATGGGQAPGRHPWCRGGSTLSPGPPGWSKVPRRGGETPPGSCSHRAAPACGCAHLGGGGTAHAGDWREAPGGGGRGGTGPVGRWGPAGLDQTEGERLGPNRAAGDTGRVPGRRDHHLHLVPVQRGCPSLAMRVQERSTAGGPTTLRRRLIAWA